MYLKFGYKLCWYNKVPVDDYPLRYRSSIAWMSWDDFPLTGWDLDSVRLLLVTDEACRPLLKLLAVLVLPEVYKHHSWVGLVYVSLSNVLWTDFNCKDRKLWNLMLKIWLQTLWLSVVTQIHKFISTEIMRWDFWD